MVKVAHIITHLAVGGATQTALSMVKNLDPYGYKTYLIAGEGDITIAFEGDYSDIAKDLGNRFIPSRMTREISPLKDLICLFELYFLFRKQKFDIVQTHSSKAGILGRIAAFLARVPVVIHTVHGWSFNGYMGKWRRLYFIFLERFCARITHKLIVVTIQDKLKGLKELIGRADQYQVIRSGINLKKFKDVDFGLVENVRRELKLDSNTICIGTVGRLAKQKDPITFIRAARIIKDALPQAHFILVGGGVLKEAVLELVRELNLEEYTHLLGPRDDIEILQRLFDVFLLTSLWEGLPRVVLQAIAAKIPIVSTKADGVVEVINHNETGFLADFKDSEALASRVIELVKNPKKKKRLVGQALNKLEEFSEEKMIQDLSELYRSFCSDRSPLVGS
jgi:glycosyltransferase involved in cell wall biosynthesis